MTTSGTVWASSATQLAPIATTSAAAPPYKAEDKGAMIRQTPPMRSRRMSGQRMILAPPFVFRRQRPLRQGGETFQLR